METAVGVTQERWAVRLERSFPRRMPQMSVWGEMPKRWAAS